jgi:hypothetical protein
LKTSITLIHVGYLCRTNKKGAVESPFIVRITVGISPLRRELSGTG